MSPSTPPSAAEVATFIGTMNEDYMGKHKAFEDDFWSTKMALKGASFDHLSASKQELDDFLGDKKKLAEVAKMLRAAETATSGSIPSSQLKTLRVMKKTFETYCFDLDADAQALRRTITEKEHALEQKRNTMKLGMRDPANGEFQAASTVALRQLVRSSPDERVRRAAWEGMRSVGPAIVEDFCEIVQLRNRFAKACGFEDYYDYCVQSAEGISKRQLFAILDDLEQKTRSVLADRRAALAARHGEAAVEAWNLDFFMAGDATVRMDPYFPFENAVRVWAETFSALGIKYRGAKLRLDLCDREHKYSNGFCHWPVPSYFARGADGAATWVPSQANFTSLASPAQLGSGHTALRTLLHEGGHAAHFANVTQDSPLCSQERPPMSAAYAENQSMFLDSYQNDAAWLVRYAKSRAGKVIPWDVLEASLRAEHQKSPFDLRSMLAVPFFERRLYELADDDVTPAAVLALADAVELTVQLGAGQRPLLAVPHILAAESSCIYHGYVLAEMSVHQTRAHFVRKYGRLVDEPQIGADLEKIYWNPGMTEQFFDLVHNMTGKPLTADDWVSRLSEDLDGLLAREKADYEAGVEGGGAGSRAGAGTELDLNCSLQLVHGDEVVADSDADGGFAGACDKYREWVCATFLDDAGVQPPAKRAKSE